MLKTSKNYVEQAVQLIRITKISQLISNAHINNKQDLTESFFTNYIKVILLFILIYCNKHIKYIP